MQNPGKASGEKGRECGNLPLFDQMRLLDKKPENTRLYLYFFCQKQLTIPIDNVIMIQLSVLCGRLCSCVGRAEESECLNSSERGRCAL